MAIYITGDAHGERSRIAYLDSRLKKGDYIIVCGDFGYVYNDDVPERHFLDDIEARDYTILFVDGNHENFPAIYKYPEEEWCGGRIHRIRRNIIHLQRGQVFEIEGYTFFTFGGGYSIDKESRLEGLSWWKEELPAQEEYDEGNRNLDRYNRKVDFILTHTLNIESIKVLSAMDRNGKLKPYGTDEEALNFYLEDIRKSVNYRHWYFGHFHRDKSIGYTRQTALWFDIIKIGEEDNDD